MSNESDKSTPFPTPLEKEHLRNQPAETKSYRPKFNLLVIVVIILIALVIIGFYAGLL